MTSVIIIVHIFTKFDIYIDTLEVPIQWLLI